MIGIYKIINMINGKMYIGSSQDLRKRKNSHFSDLRHNRHHNSHLQSAYNKYGDQAFIFEIMENVTDVSLLEEKEQTYIKLYQTTNRIYGYNARIYVDNNRGTTRTEEQKRRMSENRKGKGIGKRNHSEETVKLKSELCKNQNLNQYHTEESERRRHMAVKKAWENRKPTESHIKAIQKANRR